MRNEGRSRRIGEGQDEDPELVAGGVIARWGLKEVPRSKSGIFDNPKVRGDIQEPDLRCGTSGTSGHVTVKSSICNRGVLYKSGVYASKVTCLTLGDLHSVLY